MKACIIMVTILSCLTLSHYENGWDILICHYINASFSTSTLCSCVVIFFANVHVSVLPNKICSDVTFTFKWDKVYIEYQSDDVTNLFFYLYFIYSFFGISVFWIPYIGRARWKTSTAQIWWKLVHRVRRKGRLNT